MKIKATRCHQPLKKNTWPLFDMVFDPEYYPISELFWIVIPCWVIRPSLEPSYLIYIWLVFPFLNYFTKWQFEQNKSGLTGSSFEKTFHGRLSFPCFDHSRKCWFSFSSCYASFFAFGFNFVFLVVSRLCCDSNKQWYNCREWQDFCYIKSVVKELHS